MSASCLNLVEYGLDFWIAAFSMSTSGDRQRFDQVWIEAEGVCADGDDFHILDAFHLSRSFLHRRSHVEICQNIACVQWSVVTDSWEVPFAAFASEQVVDALKVCLQSCFRGCIRGGCALGLIDVTRSSPLAKLQPQLCLPSPCCRFMRKDLISWHDLHHSLADHASLRDCQNSIYSTNLSHLDSLMPFSYL